MGGLQQVVKALELISDLRGWGLAVMMVDMVGYGLSQGMHLSHDCAAALTPPRCSWERGATWTRKTTLH